MERHVLHRSKVNALHRLRRARRSGGFTLVELAIVVAIVGVLAVIALVGYRKYMLNAKITEARQMISAVRIAQESHRAERGSYAHLGTNFCPVGAGKPDVKVGWNPACDGGSALWQVLPVHSDGAVQFSYATIANNAINATPPTGPFGWTFVNFAAGKTGAYYVVGAQCDLADDGNTNDTLLLGSSYDNVIRSANDGS